MPNRRRHPQTCGVRNQLTANQRCLVQRSPDPNVPGGGPYAPGNRDIGTGSRWWPRRSEFEGALDLRGGSCHTPFGPFAWDREANASLPNVGSDSPPGATGSLASVRRISTGNIEICTSQLSGPKTNSGRQTVADPELVLPDLQRHLSSYVPTLPSSSAKKAGAW